MEWMQRVQVIYEDKLNWAPVSSGAPQGSVLCSMLFIISINYLNNAKTSGISKLTGQLIRSDNTILLLQDELNCLHIWVVQ